MMEDIVDKRNTSEFSSPGQKKRRSEMIEILEVEIAEGGSIGRIPILIQGKKEISRQTELSFNFSSPKVFILTERVNSGIEIT
jgi:hypothetical protein